MNDTNTFILCASFSEHLLSHMYSLQRTVSKRLQAFIHDI